MTPYLQVENVSKSIGNLILFENIKFSVHKDQKVALIAKNGEGKSTLLDIIAGIQGNDSGSITFKNDIQFSYLKQNPDLTEEHSVLEEVLSNKNELSKHIISYELALKNNDSKLLEEMIGIIDQNNAWDYEAKVKSILTQLKLDDFDKKIKELSGGQKKRVALAKELVLEREMLILDEPTNHLDLDMIEWLEAYLSKIKCTLLMVTHDRYFLERVCNVIIEMEDNQIFTYHGNYEYFLEKRDERISNQMVQVEKAQNLLKTELEWVRRMPKARGGKAKYRIDAFQKLKETASKKLNDKEVEINVQGSRLGKKVIDVYRLRKKYGDLEVIGDFSYKFSRFEKVGLVGKNGAGKSTFLNLITGTIESTSGEIEIGETVKFGYYRQDGLQFDENEKVIDAVRKVAEVVTISNGVQMGVGQFLNYFLFPPEKQHTLISKLSGGEKRRLYLVTVLMQNPNFLILDEPTNDLDIHTLNVLEDYLLKFNGCLIIVSHDRYFMDKIVDHLFVFNGNGHIKDFPGNYSIYRASEEEKELFEKTSKAIVPEAKPQINHKRYENRLSFKEKREFEQLESEIEHLENEKHLMEKELSSGKLTANDLMEKSTKIGSLIELIDEKTLRWMELSERS